MLRHIALFALLLTAAIALSGPVPAEIKARYGELKKAMTKMDFEAFKGFFAPEFVSVGPKGDSTPRDKFFEELEGMFKGATKGEPNPKLISATKGKDGVVAVKFDFRFKIYREQGHTLVHEVGTDYWKKIDGKWMFVKTVDTKMDVWHSK